MRQHRGFFMLTESILGNYRYTYNYPSTNPSINLSTNQILYRVLYGYYSEYYCISTVYNLRTNKSTN